LRALSCVSLFKYFMATFVLQCQDKVVHDTNLLFVAAKS
jgi:hypothetical protein